MKKRFLATVLCASMILGSTMAFADGDITNPDDATGSQTGTGLVEGYLSKDVFKVTLPTVTEDGIKMTLDPQGLLNKIKPGTYETESGAVYFAGATDNTKSGDIVVKNKSSFDVDVALNVAVSAGEKITLVDDSAKLADATTPSLYLEITDNAAEPNVTTLGKSTDVKAKLNAVEYVIKIGDKDTEGYTNSKTETDKAYAYLPKNPDDEEKVTFNISGVCDSTADWSEATDVAPEIAITWTVTKHVEGPTATLSSDGKFVISGLTAEQNIETESKVRVSDSANKYGPFDPAERNKVYKWAADASEWNWSAETGGVAVIQLTDAYVTTYAKDSLAVTVEITLTDGTVVSAKNTLK